MMQRWEKHSLVLILGLLLQAIAVWRHEHHDQPTDLVASPW